MNNANYREGWQIKSKLLNNPTRWPHFLKSMSILFIYLFTVYLLCVCGVFVEVRRQPVGVSLLLPCGF